MPISMRRGHQRGPKWSWQPRFDAGAETTLGRVVQSFQDYDRADAEQRMVYRRDLLQRVHVVFQFRVIDGLGGIGAVQEFLKVGVTVAILVFRGIGWVVGI